MHATGRAHATYSPFHDSGRMSDGVGYWIWRPSRTRVDAETGTPCIDVVHADGVTVASTHTTPTAGARLANALNRAYGITGAPVFDERTGDPIEAT
jgi:hypothetical protein